MKSLRQSTFLLFLVLFGTRLLAQQPPPTVPTEFNVTSTQIAGTTAFNVILTWNGSTSDDTNRRAKGYHVYRAMGATEDMSKFDLIATVSEPLQGNYFRFILERLSAGTYSFFVRAFNNNGESDRTALRVITLTLNNNGGDSFHFSTSPGATVGLGGNYRYEARAKHSKESATSHIRYKLISGPDGMTIDSLTGNISWTAPNSATTIQVKILAYLDNDESQKTDQAWSIRVGGYNNGGGSSERCAIFTGTVLDTNGNPMSGTVRAFLVKSNGQLQDGMFSAHFENGRYVLYVPAGTYVLRIEGENFQYQWYPNLREPANARQFTIACKDTIAVNMEVWPLAEEVKYEFSGQVTDASTGQGIAGVVYFYRVLNGAISGEAIVVRTNAEGRYSVKLSSRYSYIAKSLGVSEDYVAQYFDMVSSPTQATVLTPTANRTNINFSLSKRQSYNNGFSGQLVDSANTGVPGSVSAYLLVARGNEQVLERYRTVETDASGHYTLSNLLPGDYVILGIPNARPFIPGYYKANSYAVYSWSNSTRISVGTTFINDQCIIKLHVGEGRRGIIKLKGIVEDRRGIMKASNNIQAVKPLSGALVVALDNTGKAVDYAFSGVDGSYELNDLALGSNVVVADKPGYVSSTQTLVFSGSAFIVDNNIQLDALVSSVQDDPVRELSLWPNPSTNRFHISFVSNVEFAHIRITSAMGVEAFSETRSIVAGENALDFDASTLSAGSYLIHIRTGSQSSVLKLNIIR